MRVVKGFFAIAQMQHTFRFTAHFTRNDVQVMRTAMITVAQQALRKHLHMDLPAYENFEDEPEDGMMEL